MPQSPLRTLRTGLWHLRQGGPAQFLKWRRRRNLHQGTADGEPADQLTAENLQKAFPPAPRSDRRPVFDELRVGTILDEFSAESFGYEWAMIPLKRDGWPSQLDSVDFVFIESAWNGNGGAWKFKLTGTAGPSPEIVELLDVCRRRGIPTVFWNKEDPPHFDDFLPLAKLFDVVFTSDVRLLDEYRKHLSHGRVAPLAFAAQPAIHSPVRPAHNFAARDIAFAGMYFTHKFPERRAQMDLLLGAADKVSPRMEHGLEIFSRFLGDDERYQFPGSLADRVVGSLPYRNLLTAYKNYKVFLNVNSVVDSPSMCARRIFEITAAGTPVITTPSAATREYFPPSELPQPESQEEAELVLRAFVRSRELRDRTVHLAQRRIWHEHTYTHRAMSIMDSIGVEYSDPIPRSVSVVVSTNRPEHLSNVLETHAAQKLENRELIIVQHGFGSSPEMLSHAADLGIENLVLIDAPGSDSLGACLNRGIEAASGDIIAKMDDDDIYGEHYLTDQLAALRYSNADLVGKQAHYLHLRNRDIVMCRFPEREHRFTDLVMGPTLMGSRELFRRNPFADRTLGEDTDLQRRLVSDGARIYSADRFNFVQVRDSHSHTWNVEDELLLANSNVHSFGFSRGHYCF
ncbi:glycosyltransferase family protein [Brevibacterium aurantiacum]|uniref:Glycosyltransferase n=1 Tax=Brevibacterium aurantiacum TaxID=273384 RepID=A0A2A3X4H4_BREAU|nr:glycosyltransferase [Brevibacterium aurantiacum]PCC18675.1 glycosyltransferase [Brevibacterium aurantiacum]